MTSMNTIRRTSLATGPVLCATASCAMALGPEVIYTKVPGHSTSVVPGALDIAGLPTVTRFRSLDTLTLSPDGSTWMISGMTQQGTDLERILIKGSGTTGAMYLQESRLVPGGQPGELIDYFGAGVGRFDNNNNFALSLHARGGDAAIAHKALTWINGTFAIQMQQGDLYTGLVDTGERLTPSGDEIVGDGFGSIHLLDDGTIGSLDPTIKWIHVLRRPAIFYNHSAALQTRVTQFLAFNGVNTVRFASMLPDSFVSSPSGSHWLVQGALDSHAAGNNDVVVVDGRVRLHEGWFVGSSSPIVHTITHANMQSNGDWLSFGARRIGNFQNGGWASRNGELLAQTGDPAVPGENWGSFFMAVAGNSHGQVVLAGRTDHVNPATNDIVVFNGAVVLREGDPVDLNGNGAYDDDAYVGRGDNLWAAFEDEFALSDNGNLYMFVNLRDDPVMGNDLNSNPAQGMPVAFVRVPLPVCPSNIAPSGNVDWVVNIDDLLAVIGAWGSSGTPPSVYGDVNNSGVVDIDDLLAIINNWGECP